MAALTYTVGKSNNTLIHLVFLFSFSEVALNSILLFKPSLSVATLLINVNNADIQYKIL